MDIKLKRMPIIDTITDELCSEGLLEGVLHTTLCNSAMPSIDKLVEIMQRLRAVLFPGFFGTSNVNQESIRYHISANLDSIYRLLREQIIRGSCFACADIEELCKGCDGDSHDLAMEFLSKLPEIRRLLASDAKAAYEGDPAATSTGEAIFCYPSMTAMTYHRIAHEMYKLKIPLIPRIISEMSHSKTGIDIHPGATIDEEFFIDHGTGVVIGETCIIGKSCRIYQGVTLGALSFPKTDEGILVKGNARHPILEDKVIVYAGATILGRVTIGSESIVGANMWVTESVPPHTKILKKN